MVTTRHFTCNKIILISQAAGNVDTSSPLTKFTGVPQSSFLGPLVFTLYTADLPNYVAHCTAHLYADDSQLHLSYELNSHNGAIGMLNTVLESIRTWSTTTA